MYAKSTDCGATFAPSRHILTFVRYDAEDVAAPQPIPGPATSPKGRNKQSGTVTSSPDDRNAEGSAAPGSAAVDCGDFDAHCASGYTFFRKDTQVRAASDQTDGHEWIYLVYDPSKPGTEVDSGTTYARAISPIVRPPTRRKVSATRAGGERTG